MKKNAQKERELKRGDAALRLELGDRAFNELCWWAWWLRDTASPRQP